MDKVYLVELHSLLRGPSLWVGSSEDPELSLDQGAVDQVHIPDVKVDHSVVEVRCRRLHSIWTGKKSSTMTNGQVFRLWD